MNSVNIIGNVTKDLECRATNSGKQVVTFTIAVNDKFNRENTHFFDVTAWGKLCELCMQFLSKGKKVGVTGRLTSRTWETQDGQKRKVVEITAEDVEFLTPKGSQSAPPRPPKNDEWSDLGTEVNLDDINSDEPPF